MNDDAEPLAGEPHRAAAGKSMGTCAKVLGGMGAGLLALLGGLAKHGGHVGRGAVRHAGEAGGSVVRHIGEAGRGASHAVDDVGRGALRGGAIGGASHVANDLGHGAGGMGAGVSRDIRFGAGLENAPRFGEDVSRGYRPFGHELEQGYVRFGGEAGGVPANQRDLVLPRSSGTRTRLPAADAKAGDASLGTIPGDSSASGSHFPAGRILHAGRHALRPGADERDRQDDQRAPPQAPRGQP